jgi:F-type H+-transporting ATPase subunit delta
MQNPRLAVRYAKSLVDLALERNQLEIVFADMKYLQEVCKGSRDMINLLRSPVVKGDKKEKIINAVIGASIGEMSTAFIRLLILKGRESHLPEIAGSVIEQYNLIKGIYKVKLSTAAPASSEILNAITRKVQEDLSLQNVQLENEVNEALIGGFQLEFNGKLIDASIARDLRDIKKQFQKNIYVPSI